MAIFAINLLIRFYKSKLLLAHKYTAGTASEPRMFDSLMELTSEEGRKAILSLITSGIADHPGVIFATLLVVAILLLLPRVSSSTPFH